VNQWSKELNKEEETETLEREVDEDLQGREDTDRKMGKPKDVSSRVV
jgi:hypothetical protein